MHLTVSSQLHLEAMVRLVLIGAHLNSHKLTIQSACESVHFGSGVSGRETVESHTSFRISHVGGRNRVFGGGILKQIWNWIIFLCRKRQSCAISSNPTWPTWSDLFTPLQSFNLPWKPWKPNRNSIPHRIHFLESHSKKPSKFWSLPVKPSLRKVVYLGKTSCSWLKATVIDPFSSQTSRWNTSRSTWPETVITPYHSIFSFRESENLPVDLSENTIWRIWSRGVRSIGIWSWDGEDSRRLEASESDSRGCCSTCWVFTISKIPSLSRGGIAKSNVDGILIFRKKLYILG